MKQKSSFHVWILEFRIWNFIKKQNKKPEGMSLLISMGVSFFVLGMVMIILFAVSKSLERSANIARSNQVFFMTESGVEAAFYHHNARGAGLQFERDANGDVNVSQKVDHSIVGGAVEWEIHGRTTPVVGVLQENQTVQIPLFWDQASVPSSIDQSGSATSFTLSFLENANSDVNFDDLKKKYGNLDISNFDFTGDDDQYFIDWKVMRKKGRVVETFTPTVGGVNTSVSDRNKSATIKEIDLTGGVSVDSSGTQNGRVTPCLKSSSDAAQDYPTGCMTTLNAFMATTVSDVTERQLIFRPLLSFTNENGEKIPGIPYRIITGTKIPKSTYDVVANVRLGSFHQKQQLTVPETTSIGSFNYVIFD